MDSLNKINRQLSTTQVIALGFISAILIGAVVLSLPVSSADGSFTPFIDSLFTSTTSVCVTGLVVVTTATHWSLFGKSGNTYTYTAWRAWYYFIYNRYYDGYRQEDNIKRPHDS